jgi:cell division protease FtsH
MVTRHGMDEKIGQRTYAPPQHPFLPGAPADRLQAAEITAREIDLAVRDIITQAFDRATEILQLRSQDLDKGTKLLLAGETLTADDFPAIRPAVVRSGLGAMLLPEDDDPVKDSKQQQR